MTQPAPSPHSPCLPRRIAGLVRKIAAAFAAPSDPSARAAESERLELLHRCASEGLWDWDIRTNHVHYFSRFRELLGYRGDEPLSRTQLAFHPEDAERVKRAMRRLFDERVSIDEEFRLQCKNGSYRWFRGRGHGMWDERGAPLRLAGSIVDISRYKEAELRLHYIADHDILTGLPNRRLFLERVSQGTGRARTRGGLLAVLFVGLDGFKRINDVIGHDAGNRVLFDAATRIRGSLREGDTVSRLGGDEFAVLLEDIESPAHASAVADRTRAELNRPIATAEREVYVSASIGIALFPGDGESPEELLKRADVAMHQAKKNGRDNHQFYSPESETRLCRRLDLEAGLRRALEHGELEVHYQPQASFKDGAIHSVEALLRWNSPELGWVPPAQFIPLAEETGLIHPIGEWALETACAQAKAWEDAGLRPLRMCINVSARQLNPKLVETVSRVLARAGLSPSRLELEITESVMVSNDPRTEAALQALRSLGVGFAIDDFGTGYATFDYLKRLPVRTLKVDGSFVRGVCDNADDIAIVAASLSLARSLGLRVVAEGVETAEQHAQLRKLGCDDCQGYHVFRPLPAPELAQLLGPKKRASPAARPRLTIAR